MAESTQQKKRWHQIQWYADTDTPEERRLIFKLDVLIVPFAILAYWCKVLDQTNLNNAYVSGLKEDLGFRGNELVQLQTLYTLGAVLGAVPFCFLVTHIPMNVCIPLLDIAWGVVTLLQYRTASYTELAVYRFLVGWFEAAFFPAMHYVLGSWYRGDELGRRGGLFYVGLMLGNLTASLLAAGTAARLEGVNGLAGWRWMYIICATITIPVGLYGYFVLPGSVEKPNRWVLTQADIDLSQARLERAGHQTHGTFNYKDIFKILSNKHIWFIIVVDVLFWNAGLHASSGSYLLWIKNLNRFSTSHINELGSIAPALGILYVILACFGSDLFLGPAWAITVSHIWNSIGLIILIIWDVPESAKWFAFATIYSSYGMSSVFHGWVNSQLRGSPAERGFTLVLMNAISQSSTAWTPLLVFKTVESPRFPKGFPFVLACAISLIVGTWLLKAYVDRLE
ncbi:vitamin H transporter [Xylariales sp. PMI_506]|nr:vitamin H transporter [Xylariales sp. PMI_506]